MPTGLCHPPSDAGRLESLPLDALRPGPYQPRTRMNPQALSELADSIREQGVMQPLIVRPVSEPFVGAFEIIAGERRYRAATMAGLQTVPCLVRHIPDEKAMAFSLIENIQRENLNPIEEAAGLKRLIDECAMSHEAVAKAIGRSRPAVSNLLRLLNLAPPVQGWVLSEVLDMGHARSLLALDAAQQILLGQRILMLGLSVRETEKAVARLLSEKAGKVAVQKEVRDRDWQRLEEGLSEHMGTPTHIRANRKGAGEIRLRFGSLDELDILLDRLGHKAQ
jgi:ParB family transcriptional regulator, chromosome partitioning protein